MSLTASSTYGGKIVQYAGWADQQVNPRPGIEYYDTVSKRLGAAETRDFYRLFMIPGMFHCNGGPGCGSVDWLSVVTDWVEKGKTPAQIVGSCGKGRNYPDAASLPLSAGGALQGNRQYG